MEVHNEGPPIPEALLPHIFEPFRHGGAAPKATPGLGLGCLSRSRSWQHMAVDRTAVEGRRRYDRSRSLAEAATRNHPPDRNSRIVAQTKARLRKGFRRRGAVAALAKASRLTSPVPRGDADDDDDHDVLSDPSRADR